MDNKELIERLREHAAIFADHEKLMSSQWDVIAKMLREGGSGSLPRDMFEALIDGIGADTAEAATALTAGREENERLREGLRECVCPRPPNDKPDDYTVGQCTGDGNCGCVCGAPLLLRT